jgi:dihydrofolate reductase
MMTSVFIGTSVDGFIARADDSLDWLPEGGGEPHGYTEFMASVDAIVIGRKTFEKVLTLGPWHYGDKRVVVLSSRPVGLSAAVGGIVEQMAGHLPRLFRDLPRAVPTTSTSTAGSRFKGSCAPGSFSASSLRACPC